MILHHYYTLDTTIGPLTLTGEIEVKIEYDNETDWSIREIGVDTDFPFYAWLFKYIEDDDNWDEEVCGVIREEMGRGPDPDAQREWEMEKERLYKMGVYDDGA